MKRDEEGVRAFDDLALGLQSGTVSPHPKGKRTLGVDEATGPRLAAPSAWPPQPLPQPQSAPTPA